MHERYALTAVLHAMCSKLRCFKSFTHCATAANSLDQVVPLSVAELEKSNEEFLSTAIPYDAEAPPVDCGEVEDGQDEPGEARWDEDEWDAPPRSSIAIFDPKPPIPLTRAKLVALDLFDVIFVCLVHFLSVKSLAELY